MQQLTAQSIAALAAWIAFLAAVISWGWTFRKKERDIIGNRRWFFAASGLVLMVAFGSLYFRGLTFGLDFTGGTLLEMAAYQKVTTPQVTAALQDAPLELTDRKVQVGGDLVPDPGDPSRKYRKILVRVTDARGQPLQTDQARKLLAHLKSRLDPELKQLRIESIGPVITGELKRNALIAVVLALFLQLLYITFRFGNQIRFGLAADVALAHDVLIMVGLYSLAGRQVDSPFVAALLTVVGYSVMDSVVIFDRIRENLQQAGEKTFEETVNSSVNQTMTRSINTTTTTIVVILALYFFGGSSLQNFAYALLVGILAGAYSSICVAPPVLVAYEAWARRREAARSRARREAQSRRARALHGEEALPAPEEAPAAPRRARPGPTRTRRRRKGARRKG